MLEISTPGGLSTDSDGESLTEAEQAQLERERTLEAARTQAQRLSALLRLSAELGASFDEVDICRRVVHGLHDTWATICWRSCSWIRPRATVCLPQA